MKKRELNGKNPGWAIPRTILFWVIGIMNTILIRPEDTGTWKNYLGYGILLLAVIDTIFLILRWIGKAKYRKLNFVIFKMLAVFMPFYMVFMPRLYNDSANPEIKMLWKFVLAGFVIYLVGAAAFLLVQ